MEKKHQYQGLTKQEVEESRRLHGENILTPPEKASLWSQFLEKFNDIALLADLMGHESIETTRIYLRRTASEQQALVDKIVTW